MGVRILLYGDDPGRLSIWGERAGRFPCGIHFRFARTACIRKFTIVISLFVAILATPISSNAEQTKGLGMWVWSNSSYLTQEARQQLVDFCVKHRITSSRCPHENVPRQQRADPERCRSSSRTSFSLAGQHNITTAALRGNPKMFFSENHERTLRELRAIVAFSETLPRDTLFKGIKYDVEPYCTKNGRLEGRLFTR